MTILVTFLLTAALYGCLAVLGLRFLVRQFQARPEKIRAIRNHLLIPLLRIPAAPGVGQLLIRD
jgi:hypothetical protein